MFAFKQQDFLIFQRIFCRTWCGAFMF